MSEIWPPPPKERPEIAVPVPSLRRRLAVFVSSGLCYSCLGATLLLFTAFVFVRLRFLNFGPFTASVLSLGAPVLFSLIFVVVGGSLGYAQKRTAIGFAALVVSAAAFCLLFGLVLIEFL